MRPSILAPIRVAARGGPHRSRSTPECCAGVGVRRVVALHPNSVIGEIVTIYPGVVLGRADACRAAKDSSMVGIVIGDGAVLCTGAKVLCRSGTPLAD